jgi:hypothetical protein
MYNHDSMILRSQTTFSAGADILADAYEPMLENGVFGVDEFVNPLPSLPPREVVFLFV